MSAVTSAILNVMEDLSKVGISKDRENQQQHFKYRGIDDLRNTLAPILVKHKLLILPCVKERECSERESRQGGALFSVVLKVEYEFLCVLDDSTKIVGPFFGEAMDSGDKATNKALSVTYKYMCIDTFCIPTEAGDDAGNDPDASTHQVVPTPEPPPVIQKNWDGTKKVGFTKTFRTLPWTATPDDFLDWCLGPDNRLNAFQRECAGLEKQRRQALLDDIPKDMPEKFYS
jgi:ERF superfamily